MGKIKKKKSKALGYSARELSGIEKYSSGQAKTNAMIKTIFKHLQFMGYMTLRDRYGFGKDRILRYWNNVQAVFEKYEARELTSKNLLIYCADKGIDVNEWCRSISQHEKLILADYKKHAHGTLDTLRVLDSAIILYGCVSACVLKEIFGFSTAKVKEFQGHINYYVDSYCRDYLTDEMVNSILIEECGIDMLNGEVS